LFLICPPPSSSLFPYTTLFRSFFLAISLDHLGDCEQAHKSYQEFIRRADAVANKNEIEEAKTRSIQLQRLIRERKCATGAKSKRSEEHTSELQSLAYLVCRLLL